MAYAALWQKLSMKFANYTKYFSFKTSTLLLISFNGLDNLNIYKRFK